MHAKGMYDQPTKHKNVITKYICKKENLIKYPKEAQIPSIISILNIHGRGERSDVPYIQNRRAQTGQTVAPEVSKYSVILGV
jgi:hypothetical protein